ncbi:hypothetical protein [Neisseria gonorrhoeae]|uniref:hypothetical protein n=1 Tax=Neisseria gonorrhoeae TaxID=485 RepID=UPI0021D99D18|nr:hypothetical protein [Neisseria gonorrhoeae]UXY73225.1 hypothetical protein OCL42_08615 [Neisseria gonorrhoeae]
MFEVDYIYGADGCGFLPSNLTEFRKYCRKKHQKFKDDEVFSKPLRGRFFGCERTPYDDRHVTSVKILFDKTKITNSATTPQDGLGGAKGLTARMAVFFKVSQSGIASFGGCRCRKIRAEKRKRGSFVKIGALPNLYEYPLFLFYELFFNTANPLTE